MDMAQQWLAGVLLAAPPPLSLDMLGMPWWATQLPLFLYFLVSLNEIHFDLAFLRLCTCYGIPLLLWFSVRMNPIIGVLLLAVMWYSLTKSVPFSPIRVPFGRLRTVVRSRVSQRVSKFRQHWGHKDYTELAVNPIATGVYVDIIHPFFLILGAFERRFRPPSKPSPFPTSRVNYLFTAINVVDRVFSRFTGWNLLFPYNSKQLISHSKEAEAPDLIGEPESTTVGITKFFKCIEDKNEMRVSATGRLLLTNFFGGNLDTRIMINQYIRKHLDILTIPIKSPIIIVGLPRTGSSVLQQLLALDPDARSLKFWEMNIPVPPPREETYAADPRIEQVQRGIDAFKLIDAAYITEVTKYHAVRADVYEEELVIVMYVCLMFSQYYLTGENSEFERWLFDSKDKLPAYKFLKQVLQLLSSEYPARSHWILKAPVHSLYIDMLCAVFPDGRFVNTHRDPEEVVVSWTQFQNQMLAPYTEVDFDNLSAYARQTFKLISTMARRVDEYRESHPQMAKRFLDITLEEITKHPVETVEKIYGHFGMEISTRFRLQMMTYLHTNRYDSSPRAKGNRTVEENLEALGLSPEEVKREFAGYRAKYLRPSSASNSPSQSRKSSA